MKNCENCGQPMDYTPSERASNPTVKGKTPLTVCYKCFDYGLHLYNQWLATRGGKK